MTVACDEYKLLPNIETSIADHMLTHSEYYISHNACPCRQQTNNLVERQL